MGTKIANYFIAAKFLPTFIVVFFRFQRIHHSHKTYRLWGSASIGITRVLEKCPDAKFENDESRYEFIVTIPRNSNQENGETIQEDAECTKKEEDICNFCSVPRTAAEIMGRLGIVNQSRSRKAHIGVLLELGVLEMTDPDHPKSRNQKYRKKQ